MKSQIRMFAFRPLPPEPTDDEDGLWELQEDEEVLETGNISFQVSWQNL